MQDQKHKLAEVNIFHVGNTEEIISSKTSSTAMVSCRTIVQLCLEYFAQFQLQHLKKDMIKLEGCKKSSRNNQGSGATTALLHCKGLFGLGKR